MVIKIIRDRVGYERLQPRDTALFLGQAALFTDPRDVLVYRDRDDLSSAERALSAEEIVLLLLTADRVLHG